jgi:Family of unknown function (DUF695)
MVPKEPGWTLASRTADGHLETFLIREAQPSGVSAEEYPNLLEVSWAYSGTPGVGPSETVEAEMEVLEGLLRRCLEEPGHAFLFAIVTESGRRLWQWYVRGPSTVVAGLERALSGYPTRPVTFTLCPDPSWSSFTEYWNWVYGPAT